MKDHLDIPLPDLFVHRMQKQLGESYSAFIDTYKKLPVRGIRINSEKKAARSLLQKGWERIPWTDNAFYLESTSKAGVSIMHEAGAFYLQEPTAMLPAMVLQVQPGEKILDLCAAPGGKSTQIGTVMHGQGILVCNEPVPKRAAILSRNIERFGLCNTIVTCETPEHLAQRWPEHFDGVLVDSPCSGEGMFRREPESRLQWSPEQAAGCVKRQREILRFAVQMVRPGGRLVYSTCTWNPDENERMVFWLMKQFPEWTLESFSFELIDGSSGLFTCYPHQLKGEGQFTALLRKSVNGTAQWSTDQSLPMPNPKIASQFQKDFPMLPVPNRILKDDLIYLEDAPDLTGLRVLKAGIALGITKGNFSVPAHSAALSCSSFVNEIPFRELCDSEALRYMAGQTLTSEEAGWVVVRYLGLNLGWAKGSDGQLKNHYPKGLRNNRLIADIFEEERGETLYDSKCCI